MLDFIKKFPQQYQDAINIAYRTKIPRIRSINSIVITGLGGSAIGGDILSLCFEEEAKIPIFVNREYFLPSWVNDKTLVIAVSYSGNTEETISSFKDAVKKKAKIICITSGGELEKKALYYKVPYFKIPSGYPPRCALGYLFIPMLYTLVKLNILENKEKDINETYNIIKKAINRKHYAKLVAHKVYKKPVLICSTKFLKGSAIRLKTQINENAKSIAYVVDIPEMNHNEIVGWGDPLKSVLNKWAIIFLRDKKEFRRIGLRIKITKSVLAKTSKNIIDINSFGNSKLARVFSLIITCDLISIYLSHLYKIDPMPVKVIDYLKSRLKATV